MDRAEQVESRELDEERLTEVTTEADKDLMEETSIGFVGIECENVEMEDMMNTAENFLHDMSADVDEAQENGLMSYLNLREAIQPRTNIFQTAEESGQRR